jgi:CubicO group peptidase (beta-lactamase class C family)
MRIKAGISALLGTMLLLAGAASAPAAGPASLTPQTKPAPEPVATPVQTPHALDAQDVNAWLDGYMPYALQSGDVAGAVVVVVKDGQVLTQRGFGYADVEKKTPVDPNTTMFRPGSVSKLFTWTAVMQQVEAGKIDLDADVNKYLDFKIPDYQGKPITMRNLMTHTAGFEEALKNLIAEDPKKLIKLGPYLKLWTPARIHPAGEVPAYSNYGAALAGYVVERVSGEPFDDYVQHHIFDPLGMQHATFVQPLPAKYAGDMAKGYMRASDKAKPYELVFAGPAGSSAVSGADMAKFMIAHLQDGRYGSVQILKPETAKLMHTMADQPLPPFPGMALGFYRDDHNGHEIIAHGGDTVVFHSDLNLFLKDGVGLYISMNSVGKEGAAHTIRGQLLQEFADRYFPGAPAADLPTVATAKQDAQVMAGTYWASRRTDGTPLLMFYVPQQTQIKALPDGTIETPSLKKVGGGVKKWREVGPFYWQEIGGRTFLKAIVKDGKVKTWGTSDVPAIEVFQPVPAIMNGALITNGLLAACLVLLLTALSWPIAAIARRKYGKSFQLSGRAATLHRVVRATAILDLVVVVGWIMVLQSLASNFTLLSDVMNPWFYLLFALGWLGVLGAVAALFNVVTVWGDKNRSWFGKISSVVIAAACIWIVWVGFVLHLLGPSVQF